MSGKKLTRKEYEETIGRIEAGWKRSPIMPNVDLLLDHIEAVGVFAPEEPTDDEINATIAKAQGWSAKNYGYGGVWRWYANDGRELLRLNHYSPVSDLGQALEAAGVLHKGSKDVLELAANVSDGLWDAADAARAISLHLYDRIQDAA